MGALEFLGICRTVPEARYRALTPPLAGQVAVCAYVLLCGERDWLKVAFRLKKVKYFSRERCA